jgi:hypothetical protein
MTDPDFALRMKIESKVCYNAPVIVQTFRTAKHAARHRTKLLSPFRLRTVLRARWISAYSQPEQNIHIGRSHRYDDSIWTSSYVTTLSTVKPY